MKHTFYHPESETCEEPLDDYSCPRGQWMVPDKDRLGEVHCEDVQENEGCFMGMGVIGKTMTIECQDKHMEKQMEIFQTTKCSNGQILLPSNFVENTNPCPDRFVCSPDFSQHLPKDEETKEMKEMKVNYLKNLKCSKNPNKLCLPSENRRLSLFTPENIIRSFVTADLVCGENPCKEGFWPWIVDSDNGVEVQRCLQIEDKCKAGNIPIFKQPEALKLSCSVVVPFSVSGE